MKPFGIVLADDHNLFRHLMKKSIEAFPEFAVLGEASSGLELLELLKRCAPDLIILDITMPDMQGIEAAREIKKSYPRVKILMLTMHKSKDYLRSALASGVDGYMLKENAYDDLIMAIKNIQSGKRYISNLVLNKVKEIILWEKDWNRPSESLTLREITVLKLMAEGKSSREIADLLFISIPTVNRHRFNIKQKLALKSNADLIKYAIDKGISSLDYDS